MCDREPIPTCDKNCQVDDLLQARISRTQHLQARRYRESASEEAQRAREEKLQREKEERQALLEQEKKERVARLKEAKEESDKNYEEQRESRQKLYQQAQALAQRERESRERRLAIKRKREEEWAKRLKDFKQNLENKPVEQSKSEYNLESEGKSKLGKLDQNSRPTQTCECPGDEEKCKRPNSKTEVLSVSSVNDKKVSPTCTKCNVSTGSSERNYKNNRPTLTYEGPVDEEEYKGRTSRASSRESGKNDNKVSPTCTKCNVSTGSSERNYKNNRPTLTYEGPVDEEEYKGRTSRASSRESGKKVEKPEKKDSKHSVKGESCECLKTRLLPPRHNCLDKLSRESSEQNVTAELEKKGSKRNVKDKNTCDCPKTRPPPPRHNCLDKPPPLAHSRKKESSSCLCHNKTVVDCECRKGKENCECPKKPKKHNCLDHTGQSGKRFAEPIEKTKPEELPLCSFNDKTLSECECRKGKGNCECPQKPKKHNCLDHTGRLGIRLAEPVEKNRRGALSPCLCLDKNVSDCECRKDNNNNCECPQKPKRYNCLDESGLLLTIKDVRSSPQQRPTPPRHDCLPKASSPAQSCKSIASRSVSPKVSPGSSFGGEKETKSIKETDSTQGLNVSCDCVAQKESFIKKIFLPKNKKASSKDESSSKESSSPK